MQTRQDVFAAFDALDPGGRMKVDGALPGRLFPGPAHWADDFGQDHLSRMEAELRRAGRKATVIVAPDGLYVERGSGRD